jgi:hypothetical protein
VLRPDQAKRFLGMAHAASDAISERMVFNINSTAAGELAPAHSESKDDPSDPIADEARH